MKTTYTRIRGRFSAMAAAMRPISQSCARASLCRHRTISLFLLLGCGAFADIPFSDNGHVLAHFRFAGNAQDSSGNNRHAKLLGGSFASGGGLQVESGEATGLDWSEYASLLQHPYTIEMVLTRSDTNLWAKIFSFNDGSDNGWYYSDTGLQSWPSRVLGQGRVQSGKLHYLAFVSVSPNRVKFYYQGVLLGETDANFNAPPSQAIFFRDDLASGRREQLSAAVEALRISSTALPDEAVTTQNNRVAELTILEQPAAVTTVDELHPFRLSVKVCGASPHTFQWHKAGAGPIAGATDSTYTVAHAAMSDAGSYYVVAGNDFNEVTSEAAVVDVLERTGSVILLRWPSMPVPFTLEHAPGLTGPWSEWTGLMVESDGQWQIAAGATGAARFFRLKGDEIEYGVPARIQPPVRGARFERAPAISRDELSLYFTAEAGGARDIWVMNRASRTASWETPVKVPLINTTANETFPALSADGLSLFFSDWLTTNQSSGALRPGGRGGGDIWVSRRAALQDAWTAPVNLGPTVNTSAIESTPAVSSDGLTLVFASDRPGKVPGSPGGEFGFDLWLTTRDDPSDPFGWKTPVNLGFSVNSTGADWSPSLSSDGLTLYFNSNRPNDTDGYTFIWVTSRMSASQPFGPPTILLSKFPQFQDMFDPCISADGSTLYFASRGILGDPATITSGPSWHLWQVPVLRRPPPLSISLIDMPSPQ